LEISSQKLLRSHGFPTFCYICGGKLDNIGETDRDHCPPKGFFAASDRENFPIILRTHKVCNNQWHGADELVGIVADALHTGKKSKDFSATDKLHALHMPFGSGHAAGVTNLPLVSIAGRIARGMHALLYNEYLPPNTPTHFHMPLPQANVATGMPLQPLDQAYEFGHAIRKAIVTKTADVIRAYNGNFQYACTWERFENGKPFCIVAFDIYSFHKLSPKVANSPKCFIGMYIPTSVPSSASWASDLEVKVSREEMLDPLQRT